MKICGLQDREAVRAADDADYAGFVVGSPKSHRNISLNQFQQLRTYLHHATPVVVTVNSSLRFLHRLRQLDRVIIQLHGHSRTFAEFIENAALGLNFEEYVHTNFNYLHSYNFLSLDSTGSSGYGGTGEVWNWEPIQPSSSPILVAGGIGFDNAEEALQLTHADGVDVSSSVETNKQKDPVKIRDFIEFIRGIA